MLRCLVESSAASVRRRVVVPRGRADNAAAAWCREVAMRGRWEIVLTVAVLLAPGAEAWAKSKSAAKAKPTESGKPATTSSESKSTGAKPPEAKPPEPKPPAPTPAAAAPQEVAVARSVQAFYASKPGFHAKFVQAVKKKGLASAITRQGQAWILKGDAQKNVPGKMRWDYPAEEVFYFCNGEWLWSYEKRERLASKVAVKNSQLWQATGYLVGQGDLERDFDLSLDQSPLADAWALKLVPKKGTQLMKSLTLLVDKATGEVRGSVLVDPLDDSTSLQWQDPRYEATDAKVFEWTPPSGVTVKQL
jgi:outer membrane lipoprotein-sorting protein